MATHFLDFHLQTCQVAVSHRSRSDMIFRCDAYYYLIKLSFTATPEILQSTNSSRFLWHTSTEDMHELSFQVWWLQAYLHN